MRSLIIGVSLLALMAPTAYAQQAPKPAVPPPGAPMAAPKATGAAARSGGTGGSSEVPRLLRLGQGDVDPGGSEDHRQAADEFKRTGCGADRRHRLHRPLRLRRSTTCKLSERRAEAVKAELVRLGVPAAVITTIGRGEEDPLVPTKDGVREAQNRRVSRSKSRVRRRWPRRRNLLPPPAAAAAAAATASAAEVGGEPGSLVRLQHP